MSVTHPENPSNDVTVLENYGEWYVTVREGEQENVRSFEIEAHARSYADGQRLRLALGTGANQ